MMRVRAELVPLMWGGEEIGALKEADNKHPRLVVMNDPDFTNRVRFEILGHFFAVSTKELRRALEAAAQDQ